MSQKLFVSLLQLRGHSNTTWHFLATLDPYLPHVTFDDTVPYPPPQPLYEVTFLISISRNVAFQDFEV